MRGVRAWWWVIGDSFTFLILWLRCGMRNAECGMRNDGHRASRSSQRGGVRRARIVVPRSLRGCAAGGSGSHGPHTWQPAPEPPEGGTTEERWVARARSSLTRRRCILQASRRAFTGGRPVLRACSAPPAAAAAARPPPASGALIWQNMVGRERRYQPTSPAQAARALRRSAASMRAITRRVLSLSSAPKRSCT
jgi:hypothetical protein